MGCMFSSSRGQIDFDDTSSDEANTEQHNDIGAMIKVAQPNPDANVFKESANSSSQNAKRQQQQQQQQHQQQSVRILMTANAAAEAGRLHGQQQQQLTLAEKLVQPFFSLANRLAQGRKVIQSAVRVNAIDSLLKSTAAANSNGTKNQQQLQVQSKEISAGRTRDGPRMLRMDDEEQQPVPDYCAETQSEDLSSSSVVTMTSDSNSKNTLSDRTSNSDDSVILFTSTQQLCMKIVKGSIIGDSRSHHNRAVRSATTRQSDDRQSNSRPYCVFLFGAQGSCKGELAFDLVQHAPLLRTILSNSAQENHNLECPLYHHIDVAALIIANLDSRIREYIHLQLQAIQSKHLEQQQQSKQGERKGSIELIDKDDHDDQDDEENAEAEEDSPSDLSDSASIRFDQLKQQTGDDDFALITLSTKQRSVLELKLIKYSNCVSSKWVLGLIETEVDRLEARFRQAEQQSPRIRCCERVYLINLVPNQLSLFKCCLYLHQQELRLDEFKYWASALKFERRTNIKVMTKERAVNKKSSSSSTNNSPSSSTIKTITSSLGRSHKKQQPQASSSSNKQSDTDDQDRDLVAIATDALASGLNEKLGPKLNDIFVLQFKLKRRLYRARYNRSIDSQDEDDNCCGSIVRGNNSLTQSTIDEELVGNNDELPIGGGGGGGNIEPVDKRLLSASECRSTSDKLLSSSMQNLHLPSPLETSVSNPSSPRLSLSVSPPASHQFDRLSPNSLMSSLPSSSANNSLTSVSALTTSGESLSSVGRSPGYTVACADELERVVEIQLVDVMSGEQNVRPTTDQTNSSNNHDYDDDEGSETKLQRWRHRHFGTNSTELGRPTCLGYYPEPRRGFSPLAGISKSSSAIGADTSNQLSRPLLNPSSSSSYSYQLISSKISEEDQSPELPARKSGQTDANSHCLEVKRIHSRIIKLKLVSHLDKLAKLIKKARRQLDLDTDRWLAEAIVFNGYHLVSAGGLSAEKSATARFSQTPGRVVYTLRLDVHRLKTGQLTGMPGNMELMQNMAHVVVDRTRQSAYLRNGSSVKSILKPETKPQTKRKRPVSADPERTINKPLESRTLLIGRLDVGEQSRVRPASSLAIEQNDSVTVEPVQPQRNPRHVKFRTITQNTTTTKQQMAASDHLQQTTSSNKYRGGNSRYQQRLDEGERRLWISENLFVSCSVCEDKSLLDVAAALIKIYFSGQWKANNK